MAAYVLGLNPTYGPYGHHDPSAALMVDGEIVFAAEEERYSREKHATRTFPEGSIRACLNHASIKLSEVDTIALSREPALDDGLHFRLLKEHVLDGGSLPLRGWKIISRLQTIARNHWYPHRVLKQRLEEIGTPVPPITNHPHHECHAASAFHPTEFDEAIVFTLDGKGEYDSTVVWEADERGLERVKTYEFPNSLGHFFGAVTEYLGYRANNGEGKVMGLAPYGERSPDIEAAFEELATFGVDYDVTELTENGMMEGVERLESVLGRKRNTQEGQFDDFYADVAHVAQCLLEDTVCEIVEAHVPGSQTSNVCLAGGVALNCKMNKRVMELDCVDEIFIQPVSHDGGLSLGAAWLEADPEEVPTMTNVYWGDEPNLQETTDLLEKSKVPFERVQNVERYVAERLADGALVGWMQGRQEMGPRALGNRSILADPRTEASRDRVNKFVKHREEWRPFAPSLLEEAAQEYLVNASESSYMIKTFDTVAEKRNDIEAVVHPADQTTRPQTVNESQNPRYYRLISEFADITGVPVVLNTSFNDHGEPIVTNHREAIADFFLMGLDVLAIDDVVIEKADVGAQQAHSAVSRAKPS